MNIVMHCVYFPPEVGGLESHVYQLCRGLIKRGCRVSVVTSRSKKESPSYEILDGIAVWRTWLPTRNPFGWTVHAGGSTLKLAIAARGADIIHAQTFQSVPPSWLVKQITRAPLVTTWHTSHFLKRADSPFWRPIFRRFLRCSDHNLATSREIADVGRSIAPGTSVQPIPNGVETEIFFRGGASLPATDRRRIIVPRRLYKKNGVSFFVRAMPMIVEQVDAEAVVVGDGPERQKLEALAESLGMKKRIQFLGSRSHTEMPGLLSSAELAVFPSLMEATSVAALESMACELPVAATRIGGLPEIINEDVGTLFQPGNPTALANAVIGLLTRSDLRVVGSKARSRVIKSWSNTRLVDRHLAIYESIREKKYGPGIAAPAGE